MRKNERCSFRIDHMMIERKYVEQVSTNLKDLALEQRRPPSPASIRSSSPFGRPVSAFNTSAPYHSKLLLQPPAIYTRSPSPIVSRFN